MNRTNAELDQEIVDLDSKRDRLALSWIELPRNEAAFRIHDLHPRWRVSRPVLDGFRRKWMLEFNQHSGWNKNPLV